MSAGVFLKLAHPRSQAFTNMSSWAKVELGKSTKDTRLANSGWNGIDDRSQLHRINDKFPDYKARINITGGEPLARVGIEMVVAVEVAQANREQRYSPAIRGELYQIALLETGDSTAKVKKLAIFQARSDIVIRGGNAEGVRASRAQRHGIERTGRFNTERWLNEGRDWVFCFPNSELISNARFACSEREKGTLDIIVLEVFGGKSL